MPHVHRAAWVLPIDSPPIRDGWVAVAGDRVVAVGDRGQTPLSDSSPLDGSAVERRTSEDRRVILPGLTNAHTHLELSWMRGSVPAADTMPAWAARLIGVRRAAGGDRDDAIGDAIREARAAGTTLVGDVTNTLASYGPLSNSPLSAAVFFELIGFRSPDAGALVMQSQSRLDALPRHPRVRAVIVPHAPYSVSPDLFRAIALASADRPVSVHLGESLDEIRFLQHGTGAWRELLASVNAWDDGWAAPRCGPVEYLERLGLLNERLIAVHAVQLTDDELRRLANANATIVTCPRSNAWTGAGEPPVARFYAAGVRVAIGTDSLASADDLNLFAEMAAVRRSAPSVAASEILKSATLHGARALGFDADLGTVAPGKRAELIAVRIPADVEDVEEYLVSGVRPSDVSWL